VPYNPCDACYFVEHRKHKDNSKEVRVILFVDL
jgi:hypothetical protein